MGAPEGMKRRMQKQDGIYSQGCSHNVRSDNIFSCERLGVFGCHPDYDNLEGSDRHTDNADCQPLKDSSEPLYMVSAGSYQAYQNAIMRGKPMGSMQSIQDRFSEELARPESSHQDRRASRSSVTSNELG